MEGMAVLCPAVSMHRRVTCYRRLNSSGAKNAVQNYTGKLYAIISPIAGLDITGSYFIDANTKQCVG